jgi:Tn3 transposase DDE domain
VQGLKRREERRFPILLALVAQSAVEQLDEVIALFDQAVSARESRAKAKTDEALAERARKGEARQLLMDVILPVLTDVGVPDENVGGTLRDGLRSGDVFVPGSRRYADPGTYLFTPEQWQPRLAEFCQLVRKPPGAAEAIAQVKDELHLALTDLEETLANSSPNDVGAVRLDSDGKLVIPPLSAEDIPAEAKALRDELASMLPFVPIASLLIELDARTNFLACFTHAGGRKSTQTVELKSNILAVLIAGATNLGLTRMSEACGVSSGRRPPR